MITKEDLFYDSNWFKQFTSIDEKREIGEPIQVTTRWNGTATVLKGDIKTVLGNPVVKQYMSLGADSMPVVPISTTQQVIEKTLVKKHKQEIAKTSSALNPSQIKSLEEVFKDLNPNITLDEVQIYLYWKDLTGDPYYGEYWEAIHKVGYRYAPSIIQRWLNDSLVYLAMVDGKLQIEPSFVYASGNIYLKIEQLVTYKEKIVEGYGFEQFKKQFTVLNAVLPNRIKLISEAAESRIFIKPSSQFFREITLLGNYEEQGYEPFYGSKNFTLPYLLTYYVQTLSDDDLPSGLTSFLINEHITNGNTIKNSADKSKNYEQWYQNEIDNAELSKKLSDFTPILLQRFYKEVLAEVDIEKIEIEWNTAYNGYVPIDTQKIPVAFEHALYDGNDLCSVKPEKREAIATIAYQGSSIIAYDVGVGKTYAALFTVANAMSIGYCSRALIITPNQVYKQFISECRRLLPHILINEYGNMGADYTAKISTNGKAHKVAANSITFATKEALELISFNTDTESSLTARLMGILNQDGVDGAKNRRSKRDQELQKQRIEGILGRGLSNSLYNIEDLGFDFLVVDEAHSLKKVFTSVKKSNDDPTGNPYEISSGQPSKTAIKGFCLAHYIMSKNNNRNVVLLTATPFTNSPLEIYSMLSIVAWKKLEEMNLTNLKNFFDSFIAVTTQQVVKPNLTIDVAQTIRGFNNLVALQRLINSAILYKTGEDVGIERPIKYVFPLKSVRIKNEIIPIAISERVSTLLPQEPEQKAVIDQILGYVNCENEFSEVCEIKKETLDYNSKGESVSIDVFSGGVNDSCATQFGKSLRTLRGILFLRNVTLSPYLLNCGESLEPNYTQYIQTSPKLKYTMKCIESMIEYCKKEQLPIPGIIIYMDRGVDYFTLIKEYLVHEVGFLSSEVGLIYSGISLERKESIKNDFNNGKVHIIIGSSTIKEGLNLQKRGAVLFNLFIDWNPTDIKQLEGRIWRQGNVYGAVRIVNVLVEDTADAFILQKLDEKTARISEIWERAGRTNMLNLDEFNPDELKYELITDPVARAKVEIAAIVNQVKSSVNVIERRVNRIDEFRKAYVQLTTINLPRLLTSAKILFNNTDFNYVSESPIDRLKEIKKWVNKKEASPIFSTKQFVDPDDSDAKISDYYLKQWVKNQLKAISFGYINFLDKGNKSLEHLDSLQKKLIQEAKELNNTISEDIIKEKTDKRVNEIIEARNKANSQKRTLDERVDEFAFYNYLLKDRIDLKTERSIEEVKKLDYSEFKTCPPTDPKGIRLISQKALNFLENCIARQVSTKSLHYVNGAYTLERQKLHSRIIARYTSNKPCRHDAPIAILTGGLPGAGKSTWLKNSPYSWILDTSKIIHIDADEVRTHLPEYKGWNSAATQEEVRDLVNTMLDKVGTPCNNDLVYDGTMNKVKNYLPLIERIKGYGYKIFVVLIQVPESVSKLRMLERYQKMGRYVPMSVIEEGAGLGLAAFDEIKTKVDGYILVDGVSLETIEVGGEPIPERRDYEIDSSSTALAISTQEGLNKRIAALQVLNQRSPKLEYEQRLKALKLSLKLSKAKKQIISYVE